jgi:acyl carrier protein
LSQHEILENLKKVLIEGLGIESAYGSLSEQTSFFEGGLSFDSVAIVELIGAVEDSFDIQFDDDDLRTSTFENLGTLAQVIAKQLASHP